MCGDNGNVYLVMNYIVVDNGNDDIRMRIGEMALSSHGTYFFAVMSV
jgi:hypothetical protein